MAQSQTPSITTLPSEQAPPTRLPEDAMPYWRDVLAGAEQAQAELAEVGRLEQQIAQLRQSATARLGAYESYALHLYGRLHLDPKQVRFERDGSITPIGQASPTNGTA